MNIFSRVKASLRLNEAIRVAHKECVAQGSRFYIMPYNTPDYEPKLLIMDRTRFRQFKQKGYIPRNASVADLEREAFYFTPYPNGTAAISPEVRALRREQYYKWLDVLRVARKKHLRVKKQQLRELKKAKK